MSMGESSDLADLSKKLAELERLAAAYQVLEARGRNIRLALLMGVVAFILVFGWLFYQRGKDFASQPNLEKILAMAEKRLGQESMEKWLLKEGDYFLEAVREPVSKAFTKQFRQDTPHILQKLDKERDIFVANFPPQLGKIANERYRKLLEKNEATLVEKIPALKNEKSKDKMIDSMAAALLPLSRKYYAAEMEKELNDLFSTWDGFPRAEVRSKDPPLEDQLYEKLAVFVWLRITEVVKTKEDLVKE